MANTEEIQASVKSVKGALKALGVSNTTRTGFAANFVLDTLYGGLQDIGINNKQAVELETADIDFHFTLRRLLVSRKRGSAHSHSKYGSENGKKAVWHDCPAADGFHVMF